MTQANYKTSSIWHQTQEKTILPVLTGEISTEVCVIGAGIAGLTTGYLLQKEGKQVVIIEADDIMSGETGRTTAHLSAALDSRFFDLIKDHGQEFTKLAMHSHIAAINLIETIAQEEKIECDFERVDAYLYASDIKQEKYLQKELEAALKIDFPGVKIVEKTERSSLGKAILFPNQGKINMGKYISGLAKAFLRLEGKIYIKSAATEIKPDKDKIIISSSEGKITAEKLVVATGSPIYGGMSLHFKQAAYRTYALGFVVEKNYLKDLIWDLEDPYHYVRTANDGQNEILIIGGQDHKVGQANDMEARYKNLENWTHKHFKNIKEKKYEWSGQVWEPADGLAFIGQATNNEKRIFVITGTSGNGITNGTLGGMLINDLVMGRENAWAKVYNPKRLRVGSLWQMIKEDCNSGYHMIKDWIKPSESAEEKMKPGDGKVIWKGCSKIAVYKDENGKLYKCSAVCTHQKAILQWNSGEKSWDCPAHGSRFDVEGKPLCGPAKDCLEKS